MQMAAGELVVRVRQKTSTCLVLWYVAICVNKVRLASMASVELLVGVLEFLDSSQNIPALGRTVGQACSRRISCRARGRRLSSFCIVSLGK